MTKSTCSHLEATATYLLSERHGARIVERLHRIMISVPAHEAELVHVDDHGRGTLALTPRYQRLAGRETHKIDTPPVYETPPTLDQLLADARAAANTRAAYYTQRWREREHADAVRNAAGRRSVKPVSSPARRHGSVAESRRARRGPGRDRWPGSIRADHHRRAPSTRGPSAVDQSSPARMDPGEIASPTEYAGWFQDEHAVRWQREEFIHAWVEAHGTADQRAQCDAGRLPWYEVLRAVEVEAWAPIAPQALYTAIQLSDLQATFDRHPAWAQVQIGPTELRIDHADVEPASPRHAQFVANLTSCLPDATVTLRRDRASWTGDTTGTAPVFMHYAARVTRRVGPFSFKRLLAVPEADAE